MFGWSKHSTRTLDPRCRPLMIRCSRGSRANTYADNSFHLHGLAQSSRPRQTLQSHHLHAVAPLPSAPPAHGHSNRITHAQCATLRAGYLGRIRALYRSLPCCFALSSFDSKVQSNSLIARALPSCIPQGPYLAPAPAPAPPFKTHVRVWRGLEREVRRGEGHLLPLHASVPNASCPTPLPHPLVPRLCLP